MESAHLVHSHKIRTSIDKNFNHSEVAIVGSYHHRCFEELFQ